MKTDEKNELLNVNFAKTVLMILIVLCHSAAFWNGNWFTKNPKFDSLFLSGFSEWLGTFHVYCFCLISGFLFYYLKYEKGSEKYNNFSLFVRQKLKRLIVPYVFLAILWVIPIAMYFFPNYTIKNITISYALAVSPSQLWFLIMLFNVFLIFYALSDIFMKNIKLGILLSLLFYGIGVIMPGYFMNVFSIFTSCRFLIFFYIGFIIRQYKLLNLLKKVPSVFWVLFDILLFIIYKRVISTVFADMKIINLVFVFSLNLFGAIAAFTVLQSIASGFNWNNKFFRFFNKHSMSIYLFHQQIIYFTIKWFNGVVNPYVNCLINFVFAIIISSGIAVVLRRFKLTSFLLGENYDP